MSEHLLTPDVASVPSGAGGIDGLAARADAIARQVIDEHALPGLAVAVVSGGTVVFERTYGLADVEAGRPMARETIVRVGSVTKTFTAIGVMQLVEQGAIDLDAPLVRHLPGYTIRQPRGARPMTIRDVLTHTSGVGEVRTLRDMVARTIPFLVDDGRPVPAMPDFYRRGITADTPPGVRNTYANYAYALLGEVIATISGLSYPDYIRTKVCGPLGMDSADILPTPAVRERLAVGYMPGRDPKLVPYQHIVIGAAGSLHASVADMVSYLTWLSTTGRSGPTGVLSPATLATMFERHWERDTRLPGYGLGFARDDLGGRAIVNHDGGLPGFVTSMTFVPEAGFGVFAVTNCLSLGARSVADQILWTFLDVPPPDGRVPVPGAGQYDRAAVRDRLAGLYVLPRGISSNARWWNELGGEVHVEHDGARLTLRTRKGSYTERVRLFPGDPHDELFWIGPARRMGAPVMLRLRFRQERGRIVGFDGGLAAPFVARRRPPARSAEFYVPAGRATGAAAVAAGSAVAVAAVTRRVRRR